MGTYMINTNKHTNIISFTLLQAFKHTIQYMIPVHAYNPVQLHMTTYTNPSQLKYSTSFDDARKNTRLKDNFMETPRARVPKRGNYRSENERGLGPNGWPALEGVRHLLLVA